MCLCGSLLAQEADLHHPIDGILRLSGNFGEIRGGHFHTGIDIKTGGVEGLPVRAVADGFVARVAVSPTGYGKALYLEHADGRTSVYAHLRSFRADIAAYVQAQQYAQEKFAIDVPLPRAMFKVSKGETIALSGNSGSSGGPHLHFEVRETAGQVPINPLDIGIKARDKRPPEMERLWVYAHGNGGHVEGLSGEQVFPLTKTSEGYRMKDGVPVHALGTVSIGVAAIDRFSDSENICGIHRMTVEVDGQVIHDHVIDRMPFDKKRKVQAHIDYSKKQRFRDFVFRSYIAPMNDLDIYREIKDRGMWHLKQGDTSIVKVRMLDHAGNLSELRFTMLGTKWNDEVLPRPGEVNDTYLPDRDNSFSTDELRLYIPKGALYDTLRFHHASEPACRQCLTKVHALCDLSVPAETYMNVSIRIDGSVKTDRSKLLIVSLDDKGRPVAEGGTMSGQWLSTRTRSFGKYSVMADTLAPTLRPLNFADGANTASLDTLRFKLSDDLSGIATYTAKLDGKWLLMEHDPKNQVIYHVKDHRITSAPQVLEVTAVDNVGNTTSLTLNLR
jgi:hypothetical protein